MPDIVCHVMRRKCEFDEDGKLIRFPQVSGGWDFGKTLDVVYQEGCYYVVRRKGHTAWSGVGMRRYYCTKYLLLEVDMDDDEFIRFKILEEEETEDRPWREIRCDMFAKAKELYTFCSCEKPSITYKAVPPMCLWCGKLESKSD